MVYVADEKPRYDAKKENETSAFVYEPPFGETFVTPAKTALRHAIFCLDLRDISHIKVKQLRKYESDVAFVQPAFSLEKNGLPSLFATGLRKLADGRRLGVLVGEFELNTECFLSASFLLC